MTYIIFDVETTGLPDMKMPAEWNGQPHICQLGAIVTDEDGRVKSELNTLVKPDGWTIPQSATDVHGISQEDAEKYGLSIKGVLSIFGRLCAQAEMLVAHNAPFDLFMLKIESSRCGVRMDLPPSCTCTMEAARDVVQCPPTDRMLKYGYTGFKNPNLTETYRHFFDCDFEGAHDAMADVRACRDVFFKLKELQSGGWGGRMSQHTIETSKEGDKR